MDPKKSQGSIQADAKVELERTGQTEKEIEESMVSDVNQTLTTLITGNPQNGMTFNSTYLEISYPQPLDVILSSSSALPPTTSASTPNLGTFSLKRNNCF